MIDTQEPTGGQSPWRERLRALRNMPPVLGILWASGRATVTWGIMLRLVVASLPFLVAKVAQYIVNGIADVLRGRPLSPLFWKLVLAEVVLNVRARADHACDRLL